LSQAKYNKTHRKHVATVVRLVEYNHYGVRFNVPERTTKMKYYLNKLATTEGMPYKIFQQKGIWYINIGIVTHEFHNELYLFYTE
jgi:hypothetical protein